MSRLIDVEKITDDEIVDYLGSRYASCAEDVRNLLNDQPAAYDVEAVVRELEEAMAIYKTHEEACHVVNCGNYAKVHYHGIQQGIKFAIEIVKRGGRNE